MYSEQPCELGCVLFILVTDKDVNIHKKKQLVGFE